VSNSRSRFIRRIYVAIAFIATGLGILGAVLPLLPTTPFLILAFWAAARGSPRFQFWLYRHRLLGPPLQAWYRHRALSVRTKCMATGLLALSWAIMAATDVPTWALIVSGTFFSTIAAFLWTRKTVHYPITRKIPDRTREEHK